MTIKLTLFDHLLNGENEDVILKFIVGGQEYIESVKIWEKLGDVRDQILTKSHNTGRIFMDWEIRDIDGVLLSSEKTISQSFLKDGQVIFVSLRAGYGGTCVNESFIVI